MTMQNLELDAFARLLAQMAELQQRAARRSVDISTLRRGLQHLIEGKPVTSCRVPSHFVSLAQQIENIERWNEEQGWGLPEDLIARRCLEARTFDWPGDLLQAIVLVPSLSTPGATLTALTKVASKLQVWPYAASEAIREGTANVWLMDGIDFRPNTLEWRFVDLGSHLQPPYSEAPKRSVPNASDLVSAETAAHEEVLAAAAHFPDWLRAIREGKAPAVAIPGYRMTDTDARSSEPRTAHLSIAYGSGDIHTTLHSYSSESVWSGHAVATAGPMALGGNWHPDAE